MLVNVRLGYWLRNPKHVAREVKAERRDTRLSRQALDRAIPGQGSRLKTGVSPYYLFLEATGSLHENRDYIYVTDGGHIDNLGAFELLRRRCQYIIVCDAEADPKMTFEGLAHLIRLARIDLGIDIEIDVTDLRRSALGLVRAHCALGKINYSRTQIGHMLYIKASLTGDENEYISEYRARHPDFPHEPLRISSLTRPSSRRIGRWDIMLLAGFSKRAEARCASRCWTRDPFPTTVQRNGLPICRGGCVRSRPTLTSSLNCNGKRRRLSGG